MAYTSAPTMRYTGMSGIDTASMVEQLMYAESLKRNSIYKDKMLLEYTQQSYRSVSNSILTFQNQFLSFTSTDSIVNMRSTSSFAKNATLITDFDGNEITHTKVTAGSDVAEGTYDFHVNSVASSEIREGVQISGSTKLDADLSGNNLDATDSFEVTLNGVTRELDFSKVPMGANDAETLQNALDIAYGPDRVTVDTTGISVKNGDVLSIDEGSIKEISAIFGGNITDDMVMSSSSALPEEMNPGTYKFNINGTAINVELPDDGTVYTRDDFVTELNNQLDTELSAAGKTGVTASLDADGKLVLTSDTGNNSDLEVSSSPFSMSNKFEVGSPDRFYTNITLGAESTSDVNMDIKIMDASGTEHTYTVSVTGSEADPVTPQRFVDELNAQIGGDFPGMTAQVDEKGSVYFTGDTSNVDTFNGVGLKDATTKTFQVTKGGTTTNIEVVMKDGMTQSQYIDEINASLRAQDCGELTASVDADTGAVKFTVSSPTDEVITVDFDGTSVGLEETSSIMDLNITPGASSSLKKTDTLGDIFGINAASRVVTINGTDITYSGEMTLGDFANEVNKYDTGVTIKFSETTGKFSLEGTEAGSVNAIQISGDTAVFDAMGLSDPASITRAAQDSSVTYNGVEVIRESDVINIDGITLELTQASVGQDIRVEVTKDTSSTKENIYAFVDGYNQMIDAVQNELRTPRPKSDSYSYYEPLTSEEKMAMSEDEVEKWEEKSKEGLLYNDSLLRRFTSQVRTITYTPVTLENGETISLQDIGITTGNYEDGAKLIIDEEKLDAAIEERGDDIAELFTQTDNGVAEMMNTAIEEAIGTDGYITNKAGRENSVTVNENILSRQIKAKDQELFEFDKYLMEKENYYYYKFSKMEQAVMAANNQMAALMTM